MVHDAGGQAKTTPRAAADRPATTLTVATLMLVLALAGCIGSKDVATPETPQVTSNATNATTGTGTHFTWNATNESTYLAVGFEVTNRTEWETTYTTNATWNDTKAMLSLTKTWTEPFEGHVPEWVGSGSVRRNSCTWNRTSPSEPEECPRRDWTTTGGGGAAGTFDPGRYVMYQAAYGAENASLQRTLETEKPVTVHWVDEGSTHLLPLKDEDATPSYPQGAVQFNAANTTTFQDPYAAYLEFMGLYTQRKPSFTVSGAGSFELEFTRYPKYQICQGGVCRGNFGGFWYSGPNTGTMPERVPFAAWTAHNGTWMARAEGGVQHPTGAGIPFWGVLEDPVFVAEDGTITFGG